MEELVVFSGIVFVFVGFAMKGICGPEVEMHKTKFLNGKVVSNYVLLSGGGLISLGIASWLFRS